MISVIRSNLLSLQIVLIKQPGPAPQYRMQVSNMSCKISHFPYSAPRKLMSCNTNGHILHGSSHIVSLHIVTLITMLSLLDTLVLHVYSCKTPVLLCTPLYCYVHLCILMLYTHVNPCIAMFTYVYSCKPLYCYVHPCILL